MNTRKNNNSVLFLATLGVYLGLVLAGATPQVLANAAMTRSFDVKDEIEVNDNLDKKPEPRGKELKDAVDTYFKDLSDFVTNLKNLHLIDKFNPSYETFDTSLTSFSPCPETGTGISHETKSYVDRWLTPAITEANFAADNLNYLGDCLPFDEFKERTKARSAGISLAYDKKDLKYEVSINFKSSNHSLSTFDELTKVYEHFGTEIDEDNPLLSVLYKNTKLTTVNNQVFITTRLPRAGLDSLLASDAK